MFWKKKNEKIEEAKQVEKWTEERLNISDDITLSDFDKFIKKVGKFIVFNYNDSEDSVSAIEDLNTSDIWIKKLENELLSNSFSNFKWVTDRIHEGFIYQVSYNKIRRAFYDYNKAQQFLDKYLELLSS